MLINKLRIIGNYLEIKESHSDTKYTIKLLKLENIEEIEYYQGQKYLVLKCKILGKNDEIFISLPNLDDYEQSYNMIINALSSLNSNKILSIVPDDYETKSM